MTTTTIDLSNCRTWTHTKVEGDKVTVEISYQEQIISYSDPRQKLVLILPSASADRTGLLDDPVKKIKQEFAKKLDNLKASL